MTNSRNDFFKATDLAASSTSFKENLDEVDRMAALLNLEDLDQDEMTASILVDTKELMTSSTVDTKEHKNAEQHKTIQQQEKSVEQLQEEYQQEFKASKLVKKIKPFLDYCGYKNLQEAEEKLLAPAEMKSLRSFSEVIRKVDMLESDRSLSTTALSYIGVSTNQSVAKRAAQIIISVSKASELNPKMEARYVTNCLVSLSLLNQSLSNRAENSIANFSIFQKLGLASEKPRVKSYISDVFKEFKYNKYSLCPMSKEVEECKETPVSGYVYVKPSENGLSYMVQGMKKPEEIKKSDLENLDTSTFKKVMALEDKILSTILNVTCARKYTQVDFNIEKHSEVFAKVGRIHAVLCDDKVIPSPRAR